MARKISELEKAEKRIDSYEKEGIKKRLLKAERKEAPRLVADIKKAIDEILSEEP